LFFVIFIVAFSRAVYAYGFSVSPGIINLDFDVREQKCSSFTVYDNEMIFSVKDKWASEKSNNVLDYMLNSSDVGVITDYDTDFYVDEDKKIPVCFRVYERGVYRGVLLIRPYEKNTEIGIWVNLNVGNAVDVAKQANSGLITTNIISEDTSYELSDKRDYSKFMIYELDFSFILCLILFFLVMRLRKRRESEELIY
jgi:hypothetical protein